MGFGTVVLIIVLAGMAFSAWRTKHMAQHGITEDFLGNQSIQDRGASEEMQRELEELRERVQVLERIATDDRESKRLSAEIDELRKN